VTHFENSSCVGKLAAIGEAFHGEVLLILSDSL